MRRAKYNPLLVLLLVFLFGCAFTSVLFVVTAPKGDIEPIELEPPSFMGLPAAPDCWNLYDNDQHVDWMECMGVGLKSARERVVPEGGEVLRVQAEFVIFDSERALQYALKTRGGCRDCNTTEGISHCRRDLEEGLAECLIMTVRPKRVDDNATRVIGHEIMHGIYGRYHNE